MILPKKIIITNLVILNYIQIIKTVYFVIISKTPKRMQFDQMSLHSANSSKCKPEGDLQYCNWFEICWFKPVSYYTHSHTTKARRTCQTKVHATYCVNHVMVSAKFKEDANVSYNVFIEVAKECNNCL